METNKTKYDTNPLDPDVERKSEEAWGEAAGGTPTSEWVQSPTREVNKAPEADARRRNALPRIAEDLSRVPDHLFSGPEMPLDDTVRARFFGES